MVVKVVTLANAKATLSALIDRVEAGEAVAISRRHRVVAELRPFGARQRSRLRPAGLCAGDDRLPAPTRDLIRQDGCETCEHLSLRACE